MTRTQALRVGGKKSLVVILHMRLVSPVSEKLGFYLSSVRILLWDAVGAQRHSKSSACNAKTEWLRFEIAIVEIQGHTSATLICGKRRHQQHIIHSPTPSPKHPLLPSLNCQSDIELWHNMAIFHFHYILTIYSTLNTFQI